MVDLMAAGGTRPLALLEAYEAVRSAHRASLGGDSEAAVARAELALRIMESHLNSTGRWYWLWPEWTRFESSCVGLRRSLRWSFLFRHMTERRLVMARLAFDALIARAERVDEMHARPPSLLMQLDEIMAHVRWCEAGGNRRPMQGQA